METLTNDILEWPRRRTEMVLDAMVMRDVDELMNICELSLVDIGMQVEGPQAAYLNGRLPQSALATIPGGQLERSAAIQWNRMRDYIGKRHGVWIMPAGPNSSYRLYAAQVYFWNLYISGRGNTAAHPGTSNHGWGRAVDVATQLMAYYIRKYMRQFGWSHDEGARVGEWWHFTYVGGAVAKPAASPLRFLTKDEKLYVQRLAMHRRRAALEARSGRGPKYEKNIKWARWYKSLIKKEMEAIISAVRADAKKHGGKKRWAINHRGVRYQLLRKAYLNKQ